MRSGSPASGCSVTPLLRWGCEDDGAATATDSAATVRTSEGTAVPIAEESCEGGFAETSEDCGPTAESSAGCAVVWGKAPP